MGRSRSQQSIRWPCWLSLTRLPRGLLTRALVTQWKRCWHFKDLPVHLLWSTHTLSLRTEATRGLKRWRFVFSNPTQDESTQGLVSSTWTCLMLRLVWFGASQLWNTLNCAITGVGTYIISVDYCPHSLLPDSLLFVCQTSQCHTWVVEWSNC